MIVIALGDPIPRTVITNAFMVKLEFMHGDADAYTDHMFGPFDRQTLKDSKGTHLEQLLRAIEAVKDADERELDNAQRQIPGWELLSEEWHYEQGSGSEFRATYDGHRVTMFDDNGREFSVKYQLS